MNPHLAFAQVHPGHSEITGFGVIEMKDLYFLLDAVRILERAGAMDATATAAFRAWLEKYLVWLRTSPQGTAERPGRNNHGTCYDLQLGAIAAVARRRAGVGCSKCFAACARALLDQFAADGSQPEELKRTPSQHYAAFNLQSWLNLARLGRNPAASTCSPSRGRTGVRSAAASIGCCRFFRRLRGPGRSRGAPTATAAFP